jgi:Asp-tRNA(Asn)/Glu-tRNA(Gln) amidotransferase A subunit family amidase
MEFIDRVFVDQYQASINKNIKIPLIDVGRVSHLCTIAGEMRSSMMDFGLLEWQTRRQYCNETRLTLLTMHYVNSCQFLTAQRVKAHQMNEMQKLFSQVDVIATPTVAQLPSRFNAADVSQGGSGNIDYEALSHYLRYAYIANFTGIPALTIPIGHISSEDGNQDLPVGLQFMTKHYNDILLMKLALLAEPYLSRKEPSVCFDVLNA